MRRRVQLTRVGVRLSSKRISAAVRERDRIRCRDPASRFRLYVPQRPWCRLRARSACRSQSGAAVAARGVHRTESRPCNRRDAAMLAMSQATRQPGRISFTQTLAGARRAIGHDNSPADFEPRVRAPRPIDVRCTSISISILTGLVPCAPRSGRSPGRHRSRRDCAILPNTPTVPAHCRLARSSRSPREWQF